MVHRHVRLNGFRSVLLISVLAGALSGPVQAQSEPWPVKGKLFGEAKDATGAEFKKSEDVSGIACATETGFPRLCLVADDEAPGAQIVILKEGEIIAGSFIPLVSDIHVSGKGKRRLAELDAEAVAYADGSFYVTGSHGRPRHLDDGTTAADEKAAVTRRIFKITLPPGAVDLATGKLAGTASVTPSTALETQLKIKLDGAFDAALKDNGLTIEGLAVTGTTLHVGLRAPVLSDSGDAGGAKAVILSTPLEAIFGPSQGKDASTLTRLDLKTQAGAPRGIRDLVAYKGSLMMIAGPVLDPKDGAVKEGDYAIYRFSDGQATKLAELPGYGTRIKPEALLPLDQKDDMLRALILFDGPEEGGGRTVTFKLP